MNAVVRKPEARTGWSLWLVFAGFALINLSLLAPGNYSIDGNAMFATADSLVHHHSLRISCSFGGAVHGHSGACYSNFYPLLSFLLVPFVLIGQGLSALFGLPELYTERAVALVVPALAAAGAAALTGAIALRLGASRRGAVGAACAFGLGTEALTYARTLFAETLAAFLVALAVWGLTGASRRERRLGYLGVGLAVLAKPQMIVVAPAIGLAFAISRRSWRELRLVLVCAIPVVAFMGFNLARFGDPLKLGASRSLEAGMFSPLKLLDGIGVLLVSPGRGLIWFSPVAVAGALMLWRRRRTPAAAACLAVFAAILLLYAGEIGGREWATRYLVAGLPVLCAGVALLTRRKATVAAGLVALALVAQLPTMVAFFDRYLAEHRGVSLHALRWERFAQVGIWSAAAHEVRDATHTDVNEVVANAGGPRNETVQGQRLLHVVALWWWMLPAVGVASWIGAIFCLLGISAGGFLLWRASGGAIGVRAGPLRRPARDQPPQRALLGPSPQEESAT